MKNVMKIAAVAAMMLVSANVNAQEKVYGPEAHDFGVEVQFNPFSNNFETFRLDGIQARYFITERHALRFNLNFGVSATSDSPNAVVQPNPADPAWVNNAVAYNAALDAYNHSKDDYVSEGGVNFGLAAGYENHFAKVGRLDLFAGAEIGFNLNTWKQTSETATPFNTNAETGFSSWKNLKTTSKGGTVTGTTVTPYSYFEFGANLFTGADFYITKNLYVGAEIGLNIKTRAYGDVETTIDAPEATFLTTGATRTVTTKYEANHGSFNLYFAAKPALRLGWTF